MYLPSVRAPGKTRRQIVQFGGLNYTEDTRDGELSDSRGLSCGAFPALTQRKGRTLTGRENRCRSDDFISAAGKLVWKKKGELFYDGKNRGRADDARASGVAVVNTKLCVFPDKKYVDLTQEQGSLTAMEGKDVQFVDHSIKVTADSLVMLARNAVLGRYYALQREPNHDLTRAKFVLYHKEEGIHWSEERGFWFDPGAEGDNNAGAGHTMHDFKIGDCLMLPEVVDGNGTAATDPSASTDGQFPIYKLPGDNTSIGNYNQFGEYLVIVGEPRGWMSATEGSFIEFEVERRRAGGLDEGGANRPFDTLGIRVGETLEISGCTTQTDNNRQMTVRSVTEDTITFTTAAFTACDKEEGRITLSRNVPTLDFVCEHNNRLYGVCNADKTIYVSALGDPLSFFTFEGVSTDSYAVVTGTDGDFTGCVAFGGNVLFFKRDCVYRLVGDHPAEFALYIDHIAGVQPGSDRSLFIHNEVLYYKGDAGIYAYTGATPRLISGALGSVQCDNAIGANDGDTLYFIMRRADTGKRDLLAYDTRCGLWMKEETFGSETDPMGLANLDGTLYLLDGMKLYELGSGDDDDGAAIPWEATFTPFTETVHERKYPSRLLLRLELEPGAWVEAKLARDGGAFQTVWSCHDSNATTAVIPIRPGRCDQYKVRLRGEGRCLIRSIAREFALGGVR